MTIQMKAIKQQFPVVLLVMLKRVVLSSEYVGEILKCDHQNKRTEQYQCFLGCCLLRCTRWF